MRAIFKHQIMRYLITGGGAVFIDFVTYMTMFELFNMNASVSKGLSYIFGALFAFVVNKFWTFESDKKTHIEFVKFTILYASTFAVNVLINALLLTFGFKAIIGFIFATLISIVLNYIGQKFWVFKGE